MVDVTLNEVVCTHSLCYCSELGMIFYGFFLVASLLCDGRSCLCYT